MSDAAGIPLTLGQVTDLISRTKSAGANPVLIGLQIFDSLGENVTLLGSTLSAALRTSGIPVGAPLAPLLNAIQTISKNGDHVTIALDQDTEMSLNKNRVRFQKELAFDVSETDGAPGLQNIVGVAAHKLTWISIKDIQLKQKQAGWTMSVGTSLTTITFDVC
jgi:hypothetical protein